MNDRPLLSNSSCGPVRKNVFDRLSMLFSGMQLGGSVEQLAVFSSLTDPSSNERYRKRFVWSNGWGPVAPP